MTVKAASGFHSQEPHSPFAKAHLGQVRGARWNLTRSKCVARRGGFHVLFMLNDLMVMSPLLSTTRTTCHGINQINGRRKAIYRVVWGTFFSKR